MKKSIWNTKKISLKIEPFKNKPMNLKLGKKFVLNTNKNKTLQLNVNKKVNTFRFLKDSDKDGVSDPLDCRPFNPYLQHTRPNKSMKERLRALPIYFSTTEVEGGNRIKVLYSLDGYKLMRNKKTKADHIPQNVKKAMQRFYSMIKKRPDTVGEMERKAPHVIIFTVKGGQTTTGYVQPMKEVEPLEEGKREGEHKVVVRLTSRQGHPYRRGDVEESAGTVHHELEHVRQMKTYEKKPTLYRRMEKGRYSKRRIEVLARESERKAERKRYYPTYGSRTHARELFAKMTDDNMEENNNE